MCEGAGRGRLSFGSNHNKILVNAILVGKILRSVMKEKISVNKLLGQYGKILLNYDRIRPVADIRIAFHGQKFVSSKFNKTLTTEKILLPISAHKLLTHIFIYLKKA